MDLSLRSRRLPFARHVAPVDLVSLGLLMSVFPMLWEPDAHVAPALLMALGMLLGLFLAGGFRVSTPVRFRPALQAAVGGLIGLYVAWLLLKLLSLKFGVLGVAPPGLEALTAGALLWATIVGVNRRIVLGRLARFESHRALLCVGPVEAAVELAERLRGRGVFGPVLPVRPETLRAALNAPPPEGLRGLVLAVPPGSLSRVAMETLAEARARGLPVQTPAAFLEDVLELTPLDTTDDPWLLLDQSLARRTPLFVGTKRVIDFGGAFVIAIVALPAFIAVAVAVRVTSPGPVFFRQTRAGLFREPFTLIKFRTMVHNAEALTGPVWAGANDPRITRLGQFLRKSRLDELPQLWNVLRGQMSLIGPRPERPEFDAQLAPRIPFYALRHLAKPGLTGWAQVRLHYTASVADSFKKLEHDLHYVKRASLMFDLRILLLTIPVVLRLRGR